METRDHKFATAGGYLFQLCFYLQAMAHFGFILCLVFLDLKMVRVHVNMAAALARETRNNTYPEAMAIVFESQGEEDFRINFSTTGR